MLGSHEMATAVNAAQNRLCKHRAHCQTVQSARERMCSCWAGLVPATEMLTSTIQCLAGADFQAVRNLHYGNCQCQCQPAVSGLPLRG